MDKLVVDSFNGAGLGWIDFEIGGCGGLLLSNKFKIKPERTRTGYAIGCFDSKEAALATDPHESLMEVPTNSEIRQMILQQPPSQSVDEVKSLISAIKQSTLDRSRRNKRSKQSKKRTSEDMLGAQSILPHEQEMEPSVQLAESVSALKELLMQQKELEAKIEGQRARILELKRAVCAEQCDKDESMVTANGMTNVACGKPKPMLVILDGKPGKLQLSRDGVIVSKMLRDA